MNGIVFIIIVVVGIIRIVASINQKKAQKNQSSGSSGGTSPFPTTVDPFFPEEAESFDDGFEEEKSEEILWFPQPEKTVSQRTQRQSLAEQTNKLQANSLAQEYSKRSYQSKPQILEESLNKEEDFQTSVDLELNQPETLKKAILYSEILAPRYKV